MKRAAILMAALITSSAQAGSISEEDMKFCLGESEAVAFTHMMIQEKGAVPMVMYDISTEVADYHRMSAYLYLKSVIEGDIRHVEDISPDVAQHTVLMTCISSLSEGEDV